MSDSRRLSGTEQIRVNRPLASRLKAMTFILQLIVIALSATYVTCKGAKVKPGSKSGNSKERTWTKSKTFSGDLDSPERKQDEMRDLADFLFRNASFEEKLLTFLFRDYDPVARAVMDIDKTVEVTIDFVLLRIQGLDERTQVLTTTGLVITEWTDERLKWNPSHFGNLTNIIIKADKIWLPELAVMNGADELIPDFERIRVLLHSNGRLHWEPGGIFRTTCDIDIGYFPFDIQHCPLLIGAYSYFSSKMNITNASSSISTHDLRMNGEWQVFRTTAEWNVTLLSLPNVDGYAHVVFTLHLKRRYKFYIMNIVLPCVMLSVLIMIGFCLPPDAGEKISLGISVLLAFTVFLLMIADNIPRTSLAIPLIVTYLMATMTLGTVSICMTVLVLNVHHRGPRHRIPFWIHRLFFDYLARIVCIQISSSQIQAHVYSHQTEEEIWKRKSRVDTQNILAGTVNSLSLDGESYTAPSGEGTLSSSGPVVESDRRKRITFLQTFRRRRCPWFKYKVTESEDATAESTADAVRQKGVFEVVQGQSRRGSTDEWRELAQVLDRVFFCVLFIMMTMSAMVILLYPIYIGSEI